MVKRYIKKVSAVEAVRWTGYNFSEIQVFVGAENAHFIRETNPPEVYIATKYQAFHLGLGDYIVRNSYGIFDVYTKDYFERSFEEV